MKRFFLLSIALYTFLLNAQTSKEDIFENVYCSAGNYYAYPEPKEVKHTPAPSGYRPFYISTYARHGSRFLINPNDYLMPSRTLNEAKKNGVLSPLGEKVLFVVDSMARMADKRYGELTPLGARQHRGIANRMFHNFPDVFKGNTEIDARSTVVIRCILSMMAQCEELKALNPDLQITNDASAHDMYYMNYYDKYFDSLQKNPRASEPMKMFRAKQIKPSRLMKTLFTNDNYVKWKVDSVELMRTLFDVASNMQSHDTKMELYSIFTKEECYDMWRINNAYWYIYGGASDMTDGKAPYIEANLLKNILDTADSCVVKKENSVTLRFGHESCLLPLTCLLELDNYGYRTGNLENLDKEWRDYEIFPMACNIQFVFYRKKDNPDILVKVLLNEKEARLPLNTDIAPYYHWNDVSDYYRKKLESFSK